MLMYHVIQLNNADSVQSAPQLDLTDVRLNADVKLSSDSQNSNLRWENQLAHAANQTSSASNRVEMLTERRTHHPMLLKNLDVLRAKEVLAETTNIDSELHRMLRISVQKLKRQPVHLSSRTDVPRLRTVGEAAGQLRASSNDTSWRQWHLNVGFDALYHDEDIPAIERILSDLKEDELASVDMPTKGTQFKWIATLRNGGKAMIKPKRQSIDEYEKPDTFYFSEYERHWAEIAAYHLDAVIGWRHVAPVVGRRLDLIDDLRDRINSSQIRKTFYTSPVGNTCTTGKCKYFCDTHHGICGNPRQIEVAMIAWLPDRDTLAPRDTWRSPWRRSYSKSKQAEWQNDPDYCDKIKDLDTYSSGRRLLDVIDMSIFDFISGNDDRHHYETWTNFGNQSSLVIYDHGRSFGRPYLDDFDTLAPLVQCCSVRLSTVERLLKFHTPPESIDTTKVSPRFKELLQPPPKKSDNNKKLSEALQESWKDDPLKPLLSEANLRAVDRRVELVLNAILKCVQNVAASSSSSASSNSEYDGDGDAGLHLTKTTTSRARTDDAQQFLQNADHVIIDDGW